MTDRAPLQPSLSLDDSIAAYDLARLVASSTWDK
jgi:hypothetical protein